MSDLTEMFLSTNQFRSVELLRNMLTELPLSLGRGDSSTLLAFLHLSEGHPLSAELRSDADGNMTLSLKKISNGSSQSGAD